MLSYLLLADTAMVLFALAAFLSSIFQHQHVVKRWHLLLPGLLSFGASAALVAYPRWVDIFEAQRLGLAVTVLLLGALRGRFTKLMSDRVTRTVVLHNAWDSVAISLLQGGVAGLGLVLDLRTAGSSQFTSTVEMILIITAAYLVGRSVTLWMHARTSVDVVLPK